MKKKAIIIVFAVLFLAFTALSVFIPSRDNITNSTSGRINKSIELTEDNMVNWSYSDGVFSSSQDSFILLSDISGYVHTVKLPVQITNGDGLAALYYTESPEEDFSEEKKAVLPYSIVGSGTYFTLDKEVHSVRIHIYSDDVLELRMSHAEINDRTLVLSISALSMYCVLPIVAIGALFALIFCRKRIKPYLLKLKKYIPLLKNLVGRDLKVKYRRSVLGFFWSVLNPLLMALVISAVFSRLFRFDIEYFAVYYLAGSLVFNFIIECTTGSMTSILDSSALIKKVYIPKYIFPLEKCCFAFINMLFAAVAIVVVMLIEGVPFSPTILLFPIPMIYAFVFAAGLSLTLSALMVFFRDMQHLWSVWTMIWMYLTPIIYPAKLLIDNGLGFIMKANPMYYYTNYLRQLILYGNIPSFGENAVCMAFSAVMLLFGVFVFKRSQDKFILYI